LGKWKAEQLVFLDESGINAQSGERFYGRSERGKIARLVVPFGRGENFTILPAMTVDGYIACNIYRGGVTSERFREFVETDVLPLCTPFPGPRSIIIMDNAAIHNVCSYYTLLIDYRMSKHRLKLLDANSDDYLPTRQILIPLNYPFQLLRRLSRISIKLIILHLP
jgi:hypothetical protein